MVNGDVMGGSGNDWQWFGDYWCADGVEDQGDVVVLDEVQKAPGAEQAGCGARGFSGQLAQGNQPGGPGRVGGEAGIAEGLGYAE